MLQAVIFDIDGTLVDSNELHVAAWREVFLRFGRDVPPEALRAQMGKGGDQLMPVFWFKDELARFGEEMQPQRVELFMRKYLKLAKPACASRSPPRRKSPSSSTTSGSSAWASSSMPALARTTPSIPSRGRTSCRPRSRACRAWPPRSPCTGTSPISTGATASSAPAK